MMEKPGKEICQSQGVACSQPPRKRQDDSGRQNVAYPVVRVGLSVLLVGFHAQCVAANDEGGNGPESPIWTVSRDRTHEDLIRGCLSLPMGKRVEWLCHCLTGIERGEWYCDGGPVVDIAAYQIVLHDARDYAQSLGLDTSTDDWLAPHLEPIQALEQAKRVCVELLTHNGFLEHAGDTLLYYN
jgi:hypothetical protein